MGCWKKKFEPPNRRNKMAIRKGKLWKVCKRCGKSYEPSGRYSNFCPKCCGKKNIFLNYLLKKQKKVNKNEKV